MRHAETPLLTVVFVLLALPAAAQGADQERWTSESLKTAASPYQGADEQIEVSSDVELSVLETVLRFYRPPGNQARWLNAERLPPKPGLEAQPLSEDLTAQLIGRLGAGLFCAGTARAACRSTSGGGLTVSPVYRPDRDRARVVVRFESTQPYAPRVTTTQVFLLARNSSGWRIERRQPATLQDS